DGEHQRRGSAPPCRGQDRAAPPVRPGRGGRRRRLSVQPGGRLCDRCRVADRRRHGAGAVVIHPISKRSTTFGTSPGFHSAERKYSPRYHAADKARPKASEPMSLLGPDVCANSASSGFARSQMKRLVAPTKARRPLAVGAGTDGLTVYTSPENGASRLRNGPPTYGISPRTVA